MISKSELNDRQELTPTVFEDSIDKVDTSRDEVPKNSIKTGTRALIHFFDENLFLHSSYF